MKGKELYEIIDAVSRLEEVLAANGMKLESVKLADENSGRRLRAMPRPDTMTLVPNDVVGGVTEQRGAFDFVTIGGVKVLWPLTSNWPALSITDAERHRQASRSSIFRF